MPNDQGNESSQAGKMSFIERIGDAIRRHKLATGLTAALTTSVVVGADHPVQASDHGPGIVNVELANWSEIKFTEWYSLPLAEQRKVIDSLVGKDVILTIDTKDLRLHWVLKSQEDGHVQLHMNMDPEKYPQNAEGFDGHPPELRASEEQFAKLQRLFGTVGDPQALAEHSFPGDIPPTEGTRLKTKVELLPRGNDPKEARAEFVLVNVIPPAASR